MSATQAISLAFLTWLGALTWSPFITGEFMAAVPKLKIVFSKRVATLTASHMAALKNRLLLSRLSANGGGWDDDFMKPGESYQAVTAELYAKKAWLYAMGRRRPERTPLRPSIPR
jgi:hypothetical protein